MVILGLVLLAVALKLIGDVDAYQLSQPKPHGQFTGYGASLLVAVFFMFLGGVFMVAALVSAVTTLLKWRSIFFQKKSYQNIFYWVLCIPTVTYIVCFSSWALWLAIESYVKHLK